MKRKGNLLIVIERGLHKMFYTRFHNLVVYFFGKEHSKTHRISTGVIVMTIGIFISHYGAQFGTEIKMIGDGVGYFFHGIGAVPLIEILREL